MSTTLIDTSPKARAVEAADPGEQFIHVGTQFNRYMRLAFEGERSVDGLATAQLFLLRELRHGPMCMSDVARLVGTGLVDRLVEREKVRRAEHPTNRRLVMVSLTPAGERLQTAVHERPLRHVERLLAGLTPAEAATLRQALTPLETALHRASEIQA